MFESAFFSATFLNLLINLVYALLALLLGIAAFSYFNKKFFSDIDFIKEIKKGNIAAAIFVAAVLYFIAFIIAHSLR